MRIPDENPSEPPIEGPKSFSATDIGMPDSFTNGTSLDTVKKAAELPVVVKSPIQENNENSPEFI